MKALQEFIGELDRLFDIFNKNNFKGTLDTPMIVPQTNGRHKNTMGWCTTQKIWTETDTQDKKSYYEITICAEYLYRPYAEICATLLHEMTHLYNLQNSIKDTSRGGAYHNKRFKETAESMAGLIIEFDKRIGWSLTKLQPTTKDFIDHAVNKRAFRITRGNNEGNAVSPTGDESKKSSTRIYICSKCGTIIRATRDIDGQIRCVPCNAIFVLKNNDKSDDADNEMEG